MTDSLTLEAAPSSQQELIANLMQLYLHDLNEFTGESVSGSGQFEYPFLDLYWVEPERHPFLVRVGVDVAGFALVRELESCSYELAEFFVLRRYRGQRVGIRAATALFRRFPGTWYVAQEASNIPAQLFWRKVIGKFTGNDYSEEPSVQPVGARQVFSSLDR